MVGIVQSGDGMLDKPAFKIYRSAILLDSIRKCGSRPNVLARISFLFGWLGCTSPPRRIGHQMFWGCVILLLANFGQRPLS